MKICVFFIFATKNDLKRMKNVFYIQYRNIYKTYTFCMGTIGFLIPENMGIDSKIVTLALLEAKLWPNMWFRWRPFWMCHKTRLRGGKNWTPIFLAYLTPNEAIKTMKSILATEMAKMTYRTRLYGAFYGFLLNITLWSWLQQIRGSCGTAVKMIAWSVLLCKAKMQYLLTCK